MGIADRWKEDQIDKRSLEISQADDEVYKSMAELADELPDNSPRFVLLSYPLTLVCDRKRGVESWMADISGVVFWPTISAVCYVELSSADLLK